MNAHEARRFVMAPGGVWVECTPGEGTRVVDFFSEKIPVRYDENVPPCPTCGGYGEIGLDFPQPRICPACHGLGVADDEGITAQAVYCQTKNT